MSYFQKYHKLSIHSNFPQNNENQQHFSSQDFRKNSESRQSYLKAFKKYYIDKLINQKTRNDESIANKQNCVPQQTFRPNKSFHKQSIVKQKTTQSTDCSRINPNKIVALVNNNDNQLEELLYSSISQLQRQMLANCQPSDLARQNKMLRVSIQKMKSILKEKLEVALKKNKEEITLMFQEYSTMIKKLLQDKERLTSQLQVKKQRCLDEQQAKQQMEREYEDRIKRIVEQNNAQITSTKQQIQQFLQVIVQYEEEAAQQKEELDKLREKVVELELQNHRLTKQTQEIEERGFTQNSHTISQMFQGDQREIEHYAQKIENLLHIVDKLQEENDDLNRFLKSCKCSKIKSRRSQSDQDIQSERQYQKKIVEIEKVFLRDQMALREALRRKDQCIERLNLVIEEMRRQRYESVDRMTEQICHKLPR